MNNLRMRFFILLVSVLFCLPATIVYGQAAPADTATVAISEILIPQCEKIKHQKNVYYEVYTSQNHFPSPSYWYKIKFAKDCSFHFSLFPLYEEDTYDLYCFKSLSDMDVCNAIIDNKLISCNGERVYKNYNDEEVKNKAEAKFLDLSDVKVKAGDAIYIEIFSTSGKDCGHILEFKTSSSFFVSKLINKKCPTRENYAADNSIPKKQYQTVQTEEEAISILNKTFCKIKKDELMITSIKVSEQNASFNAGLDFLSYARSNIKKEVVVAVITPSVSPLPANKLGNNNVAGQLVKKDSLAAVPKLMPASSIKPKNEGTQNANYKSTADLEDNIPPANKQEVNNDSQRRARLLADKTLFYTLLDEVEGKIKANEKELKSEKKQLKKDVSKKTITKEEKASATSSIKDLRQQTADLKMKMRDIKMKIKTIEKLLEQK